MLPAKVVSLGVMTSLSHLQLWQELVLTLYLLCINYYIYISITIPATLKIILSRPNNSGRYYLFHFYKWKDTLSNNYWGSKRLSNLLSSHTEYFTDLFRTVWLKRFSSFHYTNYLHSLLVSSIKDLCTTPKSHLPFDSSYLYVLLYSIRNWWHRALLLNR